MRVMGSLGWALNSGDKRDTGNSCQRPCRAAYQDQQGSEKTGPIQLFALLVKKNLLFVAGYAQLQNLPQLLTDLDNGINYNGRKV